MTKDPSFKHAPELQTKNSFWKEYVTIRRGYFISSYIIHLKNDTLPSCNHLDFLWLFNGTQNFKILWWIFSVQLQWTKELRLSVFTNEGKTGLWEDWHGIKGVMHCLWGLLVMLTRFLHQKHHNLEEIFWLSLSIRSDLYRLVSA